MFESQKGLPGPRVGAAAERATYLGEGNRGQSVSQPRRSKGLLAAKVKAT